MYSQELASKTEYYEKRIGDSVLLVKCYELLRERDSDAIRVATQVMRTELQTLSTISTTNNLSTITEQILRVIYAFQQAGKIKEASTYFKTLLRKSIEVKSAGKNLGFDVCFRICVGQIILGEHETCLDELLDNENFLASLASAWRYKNIDDLETCYLELEKEIEIAENENGLVPWSDTWYYILLNRLEKFIKGGSE